MRWRWRWWEEVKVQSKSERKKRKRGGRKGEWKKKERKEEHGTKKGDRNERTRMKLIILNISVASDWRIGKISWSTTERKVYVLRNSPVPFAPSHMLCSITCPLSDAIGDRSLLALNLKTLKYDEDEDW